MDIDSTANMKRRKYNSCGDISRVVHGTYLAVPSHSNLCLSYLMGFPLHYYNINMEYNSIKIIKFMKVYV